MLRGGRRPGVHGTHSLMLALVATAAAGALFGLANGFLITVLRVPPFIGTLGMMGVARGFALIFVNGVPIYGLERYKFIGQGKLFDVIPVPTIIVLVIFVARLHRPHAIRGSGGSRTPSAATPRRRDSPESTSG